MNRNTSRKSNFSAGQLAFISMAICYVIIGALPLLFDLEQNQKENLLAVNQFVTITAGAVAICETIAKIITLIEKPTQLKAEKLVSFLKNVEISAALILIIGSLLFFIFEWIIPKGIDQFASSMTFFAFACFFFNVFLDEKIEEHKEDEDNF